MARAVKPQKLLTFCFQAADCQSGHRSAVGSKALPASHADLQLLGTAGPSRRQQSFGSLGMLQGNIHRVLGVHRCDWIGTGNEYLCIDW